MATNGSDPSNDHRKPRAKRAIVQPETIRLLIACPDARGIIASVANFIADHGGNILEADQHSELHHGEFFMRIEIERGGFSLDDRTFDKAWEAVADRYRMRWRIDWGVSRKRMAILVSREEHCLNDLLWRRQTGEIDVELPLVASNHETLRDVVESFGIAYHHLPITPKTKMQQERQLAELLDKHAIDFLVLARYMQILSPGFVGRYPQGIINIHHSFLPAFAGSKPYHQAFDRGVKVIGATSHYVTDQLDAGPIIAQRVTNVDHRDTIGDLIRKGRDLERMVLATAVRQHAEDRILVSKNKTVVFE